VSPSRLIENIAFFLNKCKRDDDGMMASMHLQLPECSKQFRVKNLGSICKRDLRRHLGDDDGSKIMFSSDPLLFSQLVDDWVSQVSVESDFSDWHHVFCSPCDGELILFAANHQLTRGVHWF